MRKILDEKIVLVGVIGAMLDSAAIMLATRLGLTGWAALIVGFLPSTLGHSVIKVAVNAICSISMEFGTIVIITAFIVSSALLWRIYEINILLIIYKYIVPGLALSFLSVLFVHYKLNKTKKKILEAFKTNDGKLIIDKELAKQELDLQKGENREIIGEYDKDNSVCCENGIFVGKHIDKVKVFKGIPYALPPVGKLRWKAPQRVEPSSKIYEAFYYGNTSPQPYSNFTVASLYGMDEDCLTLNIWKSDRAPKKCAVIVYLNTYDWCVGGTATPICDGDDFVRENRDVIFVNINFRLGLLGNMDFSDVPGGEEYRDSKNLSIQDQIEALQWIHRNIESFGGDPDNVTLMGSAGGGTAAVLLSVIPKAKGLFRRVISVGGTVHMTNSLASYDEGQKEVRELLGAASMEEYLYLTSEELAEAMYKVKNWNAAMPVRDGVIIPEDIRDAFFSGAASEIDMLISVAKEELLSSREMVGDDELTKELCEEYFKKKFDGITPSQEKCLQEYMELSRVRSSSSEASFVEFFTELFAHYPMLHVCKAHAKSGGSCRYLEWDIKSPVEKIGANSIVTSIILLGKEEYNESCGIVGDPLEFRSIRKMLVNFIKRGDPSLRYGDIDKISEVDWPPFDNSENVMVADEYGHNLDDGHLSQKLRKLEPLDDRLM